MECVARAVKENGGKVIGVVPAKLEENGKVSILLDEEIHTRNLSCLLYTSWMVAVLPKCLYDIR